jgi:hypothetical protein
MKQHLLITTITFFFITFLNCSGGSEPQIPATDGMVIEAGQGITSAMFQTLSGQLSGAIEEGGIPHALQFCSVEAIPLTEELSEQYGTDIKRATHRPRNPDNQADEKELAVIETYINAIGAGTELAPQISRNEYYIRYFAPIRIGMDTCLQCHGSPETDINSDNLNLIRSLYPDDQATGFSMGDLRGIWSVTLPADSVSVQQILEMLE